MVTEVSLLDTFGSDSNLQSHDHHSNGLLPGGGGGGGGHCKSSSVRPPGD